MRFTNLKFIIRLCVFCLIAFSVVPAICSGIPKTMNHQGYLTDKGGHPVNADVNMTFALFDDDGNLLWVEDRIIEVTDGQYAVTLGEKEPINLPFDQPYRLGVTVNGETMDKEYPLTSVPYAFGGRPVVNVTEENFENVHVREGMLVVLEGGFSIDGDYIRLDIPNLMIHGGQFTGAQSAKIEFGRKSRISGATFENLVIEGSDLVFENCSFSGNIELPSTTLLRDCILGGVESSSTISLESSKVVNSNLRGATRLTNCDISHSVIQYKNANRAVKISGCFVQNSSFYLGYGSIFTGNECRRTYIPQVKR